MNIQTGQIEKGWENKYLKWQNQMEAKRKVWENKYLTVDSNQIKHV